MRDSGSDMLNLNARREFEFCFGSWFLSKLFWIGIGFWLGGGFK